MVVFQEVRRLAIVIVFRPVRVVRKITKMVWLSVYIQERRTWGQRAGGRGGNRPPLFTMFNRLLLSHSNKYYLFYKIMSIPH